MKLQEYHFTRIPTGILLLMLCLSQTNALAQLSYTFNGNGNWNNAANWNNNNIPPSILTSGYEIIIDPPTGGECILNAALFVLPGATLTVAAGANFILTGNLSIPAPPSHLTATSIITSTTAIIISWQDNSNDENGFKLERKTGAGGTYTQVAGTG